LSNNLFWGFQEKRTRYGKYNLAEPEKALLDWVYLHRQEGSTINTDELDVQALDRSKLLRYAAQFPLPVKQQIVEALASFNSAQLHPWSACMRSGLVCSGSAHLSWAAPEPFCIAPFILTAQTRAALTRL
jgi:hypothetical protein